MEKDLKNGAHVEIEDNGNFDRSWRDETWFGGRALSAAAAENTDEEKSMTTLEAIKANKKAIFWSLIISTCVIMEGYDTNLLSNFFAYPSFQKKFGDPVPKTVSPSGYSLSAGWQSGLSQGGGAGSILGTILNGWLVTAFGPRKVVLCTLCVMTCFLFIVFFAPNKEVLLAGEILLGFEW
jgi:SP family general alpha glucoside:H+ symporter-like MFS transporter